MDTLTLVIFLIDMLDYNKEIKRTLHKIQVSKIESLIRIFYTKINDKQAINSDEYLELYKLCKHKITTETERIRKNAIKETLDNIKKFLITGEEKPILENENKDELISTLNKAYLFILESLRTNINEIINEPLNGKDIIKLKTDNSRNSHIGIVKLFIESNCSKEIFCRNHFISEKRLERALKYVLQSEDETLKSLKDSVVERETEEEQELELVEQVLANYNRREKNISIIEFQALSKLTLTTVLRRLREKNSPVLEKALDLFYEYQNRLRLKPVSFEQIRNTKTIINGRELTNEDFDIIEDFIDRNNYLEQNAIYTYVREAYLKGNIEEVNRENLKRRVLERFNIKEKDKVKNHK